MTGFTHGRRSVLLSMTASLALATIGGTTAARAEDTIKIGLTTALTGPFNEFGEGMHRGVILAIEKRNRDGGVLGKQVELAEALDDQLVPDRAVQNMRRILDNKDIVGMIGPSGSGPTLAVVDMVAADGRPMMNHQAQTPAIVYPNGLDKPPRPNVFSTAIQNNIEASMIGQVLAKRYKKIGIVHESTGYGVTGQALIKAEILSINKDAQVTNESYNQRDQDMTAQLVRVQRFGADVVMVIGLGADLAVIRKNMVRLNMTLPLYTSAGGLTVPYVEGAGDLVIGTRGAMFAALSRKPMRPPTKEVLDAYKAKYGTDRWWGNDPENPQPTIANNVIAGYDGALMLFAAIQRAGSTKAADICKALEATTNFPGANGTYSFSATVHDAIRPADMGIFQYVKTDGRIHLEPVTD
jgi:branched-chain amino acid transport system substrate-binding protein